MNRIKFIIILLFSASVLIFFYPVITAGRIPFPGDLLIAEYKPWQSYSYLGYGPGSYPNKAQFFDTIRQIYPWRTLATNELKKGRIPLWNPYNFSGAPLMANVQSALFYPLNGLYLLLPQPAAWTILVILQHLLAGLFTYVYARKIGATRTGAFIAGISFAFSLFMTVFSQYNTIGHVLLWLPLILVSIEYLLEAVEVRAVLLFVLSLTSSLLAGHLQFFAFILAYSFVYLIFRLSRLPRKQAVKKGLTVTLLIILALGISMPQLIPSMELIGLSARVSQPYESLISRLLIQPVQLAALFSPDLFGNPATRSYLLTDSYPGKAMYLGLVPLLLSLFMLTVRNKKPFVRFFLTSAGVLLLFLVRSPLTEVLYRFNLPLISSGAPTNAIFLLTFSLSIAAAFGLSESIPKHVRFFRFLLTAGVLFALVLATYRIVHIPFLQKNALYTVMLFIIITILSYLVRVIRTSTNIIAITYIIVTLLDLGYFFHKFTPFVPPELVYPPAPVLTWLSGHGGINRFWGYGSAGVEPNFASQQSLFSPDGYDPLYIRRYGELIGASENGRLTSDFTGENRSDAVIAKGYGNTDFPSNMNRLKILNLLGVRFILDRAENGSTEVTFPTDKFSPVYVNDGWTIFENRSAVPRIALIHSYKMYHSGEEFERLFFDEAFDPTKTVLLEEIPAGETPGGTNSRSDATLRSYTPGSVEIVTQTDAPAFLFLSDSYYPGWKASVDGSNTKIYRANYAFRSVLVPKGRHTVSFIYQPDSFSLGLKLSMISVASLGIFLSIIVLRRKRL